MFHTDDGTLLPELKSPMLQRVLHDNFPELRVLLKPISSAFDAAEAKRDSRVTPRKGSDPAYDAACQAVAKIQGAMRSHPYLSVTSTPLSVVCHGHRSQSNDFLTERNCR